MTNHIQYGGRGRQCPTISRQTDLEGTHIMLTSDVSQNTTPNIIIPRCMKEDLLKIISEVGQCKIQFGLLVQFTKEDGELKTWRLSNKAVSMSSTFIKDGIEMLKEKLEIYSSLSSSWRIDNILEISMVITRISDIIHTSGSSFLPTPISLLQSHSVVNVKNDDDLCFLYSILSIIKYDNIESHRQRVSKYAPFLSELKYQQEWFPMKLVDITKFEIANPGLAINVFSYNEDDLELMQVQDDIFKNPFVDIIRRSKKTGRQIYLLLIEEKDKFHYIAVTNLNRLLNFRLNDVRIQSHWCEICLHGFQKIKAYENHKALCQKNVDPTTLFDMPKEKFIAFKDWSKSIKRPFVIYADFESILPKDEIYHQRHEPISAGCCLLQNGSVIECQDFVGPNCVIDMLLWVEKVSSIVSAWFKNEGKKEMVRLTTAQWLKHMTSTVCYLCKKTCNKLVRDHDHFTGEYIGAACSKCNLSRKLRPTLPIVFHNLRGYDMHHILKYAISKFKSWELSCIPQSMEKFMSLIVYIKKCITIRFIDSFMFLPSSLAKLAKNLDTFPLTSQSFDMTIINGKGIFPYDMATSLDVLEETTSLPPIWNGVTAEEYKKALSVWEQYECRNLKDYMLMYMKLDVLLLADVFEEFRRQSLADDGLEPLAFFSIPGMSYASALMQLERPIELIQDPEMYKFFEGGIRGGMTFVNKHHVLADDNTELLYIDVNNLYGWALSQKLPYGDFEWVESEGDLETLLKCCGSEFNFDGEYGYTLEVDLFIPNELHDKLDDLPVAPESCCPPDSKVKKLLLTHTPKNNYVVHCKLLQIFMSLGVQVTKLHRAVKFRQMNVFKNYIEENTRKRAASKNEFGRTFFKLKNNSLYGKMVENLKKRLNVRLCNNSKKLVTYTSKPQFRRSMKIADDLIAVLLIKDRITLDRPSYIGQTVLDLSKVRMYQLQYYDLQKYRDEFNCSINIVAGDTDSFFLEVKNISVRETLLPRMIEDEMLDTSNYSVTDSLHSKKLDSVIGKFKDESKGLNYHEWIFLRPKCYSLKGDESSMKAKGVRLGGSDITHQSYLKVYEEGGSKSIFQTRINSINHQLFTIKNTKIALSCMDDKRCWTEKNKSVAYDHYSIV